MISAGVFLNRHLQLYNNDHLFWGAKEHTSLLWIEKEGRPSQKIRKFRGLYQHSHAGNTPGSHKKKYTTK